MKPDRNMILCLTHWSRVTHICVSKLTNIVSYNILSLCRYQAKPLSEPILIRIIGAKCIEIWYEIHRFSFKKMCLKISSAKWRQFVSAQFINHFVANHIISFRCCGRNMLNSMAAYALATCLDSIYYVEKKGVRSSTTKRKNTLIPSLRRQKCRTFNMKLIRNFESVIIQNVCINRSVTSSYWTDALYENRPQVYNENLTPT